MDEICGERFERFDDPVFCEGDRFREGEVVLKVLVGGEGHFG